MDGYHHMLAFVLRQQGPFYINLMFQMADVHKSVVQLYVCGLVRGKSLGINRFSNEEIQHAALLNWFLNFRTLWYLCLHHGLDDAHVRDNHEEEQHGEYQVGHSSHIQSWYFAIMCLTETAHSFSVVFSLMRLVYWRPVLRLREL